MKAVTIGSCNIDYVYNVEHFIQPGETMNCVRLDIGCGGKGLNQSVAMAQAGVNTFHAGLIGTEGKMLKEKLDSKGINTDFVAQGTGVSGHAIIQVDKNGQNCILLYGGTNKQFSTDFIDRVLDSFSSEDIVVLQNEINNVPYIIKKASAKGMKILFNAAPYSDEIQAYPLEKVTWLIINEVEGAGLAGTEKPDDIIRCLQRKYADTNILLTLGGDGCLYQGGGERIRMGACSVKAIDTTAAGDTFIGYFVRGIVDQIDIKETLKSATVASALTVMRAGAADSIPSYTEVISANLCPEGCNE